MKNEILNKLEHINTDYIISVCQYDEKFYQKYTYIPETYIKKFFGLKTIKKEAHYINKYSEFDSEYTEDEIHKLFKSDRYIIKYENKNIEIYYKSYVYIDMINDSCFSYYFDSNDESTQFINYLSSLNCKITKLVK